MKTAKMTVLTFTLTTLASWAQAQTGATTGTGMGTTATSAAAPAAADGTAMTDGHIIHIMKTANEGEVDMGKVAKSRAENKDVKAFANTMIDEHKKNEKDGKAVAKKTKVKARENETSKSMKSMVEAKVKDLKKMKGAEFDKAYIEQQIAMHQQLINDLDSKLIPAAQSPDLKTYLETTKTHVQHHLTRAQEIQTSLNK